MEEGHSNIEGKAMNLSPNFTLAEFILSGEASRRGIKNDPPVDLLPALKRTALGMETVRTHLGNMPILISSGYRSLALNRALGSKDTSQHLKGEAVDFICPRFGSPSNIVAALKDSDVPYDQLILEFARNGGGWVHVSFSASPRRQAFALDDRGVTSLRA
jgi:zinc D-Ala-D-Ala carboxypeptidase